MPDGIEHAFKTKLIADRAKYLHPITLDILTDAVQWATGHGLPASITETVTTAAEDQKLKRVSRSHAQGRAFDLSTRGWDKDSIALFIKEFSAKYSDVAATGGSGKPALIVHHDAGHGDHFHVQISAKYSIPYQGELA